MSRRVAILISSILLLGMATPAVAKDEIRIVSVSPATNRPLQAGASVPFEISLEYKVDRADYRQVRIEILRGSDGEPVETLSRWAQAYSLRAEGPAHDLRIERSAGRASNGRLQSPEPRVAPASPESRDLIRGLRRRHKSEREKSEQIRECAVHDTYFGLQSRSRQL